MNRVFIVSAVVIIVATLYYFDVNVDYILNVIRSLPFFQSALVFVLASAFATVTFIPTTPFNLFGGAFYGVVWGTLLTTIGLQLGVIISYFLSRSLLRDFAEK